MTAALSKLCANCFPFPLLTSNMDQVACKAWLHCWILNRFEPIRWQSQGNYRVYAAWWLIYRRFFVHLNWDQWLLSLDHLCACPRLQLWTARLCIWELQDGGLNEQTIIKEKVIGLDWIMVIVVWDNKRSSFWREQCPACSSSACHLNQDLALSNAFIHWDFTM